jgi:hypothetical protein
MHDPALRRNLVLLPWAMVAGAVVLIVMSLVAYDAAASVRYKPWTPTLGGIIFSIPLLVAGLLLVRSIRDRTEHGFRLERTRLYFGALGLIVWIALGLAYVVQIGNSSTYEGAFNQETQRWDPNFSETSFYYLTLGMALVYPTGASIAAARYLYLQAIQPVSDHIVGPDATGTLISEMAEERRRV